MAKKLKPQEKNPDHQISESGHKYYVIVLGTSGAGKTVYLASMYNRLMVQDPAIGFYLATDRLDRRELVGRYESLQKHQWPAGTRYSEIREWNFTCQVPSSNAHPYSAMEFVYLDYPGEGLTSTPADPMILEQLDSRIEEADALLGIIDGHKIYAALSGKPLSFATSLNQDLGNILPELQQHATPAQFIITKWDLLINHGYSMKQVIDQLLTITPFRTYVENCKQNRIPVRIVPVSSVGMNYARLNANGEMQPITGGDLTPYYTEMPLACILFDQIEMRLQKLKNKENEAQGISTKVSPKWKPSDLLKKISGQSLIALHSFLPEKFQWGEKFVEKINDKLEAPYDEKVKASLALERELQQEKEASLKNIRDQQTAVEHVLNSMQYLRFQLEREYPESVLSH